MRSDTELPGLLNACFVESKGAEYLVVIPHYAQFESRKTAVFRKSDIPEEIWKSEAIGDSGNLTAVENQHDIDVKLREIARAQTIDEDSIIFARMSLSGGKAILQTRNEVVLVDVKSKAIESRSLEAFPEFSQGAFAAGDSIFFALTPIPGDSQGMCNLNVFDLGTEYFAPQSVIPYAIGLTDDADDVLYGDYGSPSHVEPYPSLEDLIRQGEALVKSHPVVEGELLGMPNS